MIFLVKRVENDIEYHEAIEAGYKLFQGFFFSKLAVVLIKDLLIGIFSMIDLLVD